MANPVDPGTFDAWLTDRKEFEHAQPKTSDTGTFDFWITDRLNFWVYVEAAAAPVAGWGHLLGQQRNRLVSVGQQ